MRCAQAVVSKLTKHSGVSDPIKPSILYGFGEVEGGELRSRSEVRDRARDLEHAVVGERGDFQSPTTFLSLQRYSLPLFG